MHYFLNQRLCEWKCLSRLNSTQTFCENGVVLLGGLHVLCSKHWFTTRQITVAAFIQQRKQESPFLEMRWKDANVRWMKKSYDTGFLQRMNEYSPDQVINNARQFIQNCLAVQITLFAQFRCLADAHKATDKGTWHWVLNFHNDVWHRNIYVKFALWMFTRIAFTNVHWSNKFKETFEENYLSYVKSGALVLRIFVLRS